MRAGSRTAKRALLVRTCTEQVPELADHIFWLQICRVEMAWNQRLVAAHASWHE
jgi:hypothetical protein